MTSVQFFRKANLQFQHQRLRFAFSGSSIKQSLDYVEKCIDRLEKLLHQVDRVTVHSRTLEASRTPAKIIFSAEVAFWRRALQMYTLLTKAVKCSCRTFHVFHLLLQPKSGDEVSLRMRISPGDSLSTPTTVAWGQKQVRIQLDTKARPVQISPLRPGPQHNPQGQFHGQSSGLQSGYISVVTGNKVRASGSMKATQPQASSVPNEISDLCRTMSSCDPFARCLSVLVDYSDGSKYSVNSEFVTPGDSTEQTLSQLLEPSHNNTPALLERYDLALLLANSYLQLYPTPWLGQPLTGETIRIPLGSAGSYKYDRPLLAISLVHTDASAEGSPDR